MLIKDLVGAVIIPCNAGIYLNIEDEEYGIVCNFHNVTGHDKVFREGGKLWMVYFNGGDPMSRHEFYGKSRGGRYVRKWASLKNCSNFRSVWVPPRKREKRVRLATKKWTKDISEMLNNG